MERLLELFTEVFVYLQVLLKLNITEARFTMENKLIIQDLFHYTEMFQGNDQVVPDLMVNYHVNAVLTHLEEIQKLYDEGVTHV